MSKEINETPESPKAPSTGMKIASVVAATTVTIVLTAVANTVIQKVSEKIQNKMVPDQTEN